MIYSQVSPWHKHYKFKTPANIGSGASLNRSKDHIHHLHAFNQIPPICMANESLNLSYVKTTTDPTKQLMLWTVSNLGVPIKE